MSEIETKEVKVPVIYAEGAEVTFPAGTTDMDFYDFFNERLDDHRLAEAVTLTFLKGRK